MDVPRGLVKRGQTWHISRVINGRQVRVSTKCTTLPAAIAYYRQWESQTLVAQHDSWWAEQVREAAESRSPWVSRLLVQVRKGRKANSLDLADVVHMAVRSQGRCEVSGLPFSFEVHGKRRPFAPSIDRISSDEGYTPANTRLVCYAVNVGMNCWGDVPFLRICRALAVKDISALAGL
jgi:hypothetical protein